MEENGLLDPVLTTHLRPSQGGGGGAWRLWNSYPRARKRRISAPFGPAEDQAPYTYHDGMNSRQKVTVFALLLSAVAALTILFASGLLRFGLHGAPSYVIYIVAGALAAMLTFGLLQSEGSLRGWEQGLRLRLGGSIVALVVVAAGGGLYERYLHQPATFNLLLVFWTDDPCVLAHLSGEVVVYAGNRDILSRLDGSGRTRLEGLPSDLLRQPLSLSLAVPGYTIVKVDPAVFTDQRPIQVQVERSRTYAEPREAQVFVDLAKAMVVDFGPRPDQRIVSIVLRFRSDEGLPVPLDSTARFKIFSESGAPLWEYEFRAAVPYVLALPGLSSAVFEGLVPKDQYASIASGCLAKISLSYDKKVENVEVIYTTGLFPVSSHTFRDLSNP